jgi:hypothetical protein
MRAQLYCITCLVNGWKYWGVVFRKNKTYLDRFEEHMNGEGGKHLYKGVIQYGRDCFKTQLVEEGELSYILQREIDESKHTQYKQKCGWNGNVGRAIYNDENILQQILQKRTLKQKETSQKVSNTQKKFNSEKKQLIQIKRKNTIKNKAPEDIERWRKSIAAGWKGRTKQECEKLQKQSNTLKEKWKSPTPQMLAGKIKESLTKTGRTKENHDGIRRQSEKLKGKRTGESNPSFKGWWMTPYGKFPSLLLAGKSVGYSQPENVRKLCTKNTKIDRRILNHTNLPEIFFKCMSWDIGFGFIPKN